MAKYQDNPGAEFVRKILDYDPQSGVFRWKHREDRAMRWNSRWAGKIAGYPIKGHIRIQIDGKPGHYAARLAWLYVYGEWPEEQIDHRDTVRSHNWIGNLRKATNAQNMQNRTGPQRNNSSGFLGVTAHGNTGKWRARIQSNGIQYEVGIFETPEAAAKARDAAARAIHGEFARTNS